MNKLRTGAVRSRKYLRSLFSKSLENGLTVEEREETVEESLSAIGLGSTNLSEKSPIEMRRRKRSESNHVIMNGKLAADDDLTVRKEHQVHTSGLVKLSPDDPRALDFQSHIRLWFHDVEFKEIHRDNMVEWISWSLYGAEYHQLVKERKEWIENGKPEMFIDGISDDDDTLEIEGDKLSLVEHCLSLSESSFFF